MASSIEHPTVRHYRIIMRVLGLVYAVGALSFLFLPGLVVWIINLGDVLNMFASLPGGPPHFWVPLAASMMVMLVAVTFAASARPDNQVYPWVHNLSKFTSSMGYLYYFAVERLEDGYVFGYLVGFVVDFIIFLCVSFFTLRVAWVLKRGSVPKTERPAEAPSGNKDPD
ncbi:MAG: hypothetical protein ACLFTT_11670 [Candidatus Hydrogenedentota bacterium]